MHRRDFIRCGLSTAPASLAARSAAKGWDQVGEILARIRPLQFPDRAFDIARLGAKGDGVTDSRPAIRRAIRECHAAGGGRVTIPPGRYLSNGPLHLESNVNLHLAEGAVLRFGVNPADYLPAVLVRWEGVRCYNYSPLIYAFRKENIAITGRGVLDGQTLKFWHAWRPQQTADQTLLRGMGDQAIDVDRRIFGEGHHLRPPLFQPYECRNILIEGVTFRESPYWNVHPTFCTSVTVPGIRIQPGIMNDDGVDPDSSRDVLIEDCVFETTDDNVAIKSGRDRDGRSGPPCENIVIRRCHGVRAQTNAFAIGSEISGGVRNVFIEKCTIGDTGAALYVKANSDRGGTVENVWMRSNTVEACDYCIRLETDYKGVVGHPYPPLFRNLHFENIRCRRARKCAVYSVGIASRPIRGVYLDSVTVDSAAAAAEIANTRDLRMRNVRVNGRDLAHR